MLFKYDVKVISNVRLCDYVLVVDVFDNQIYVFKVFEKTFFIKKL